MEKSHSMKRAEELRILIATVKIKHKLTNAQLAKEIGIPVGLSIIGRLMSKDFRQVKSGCLRYWPTNKKWE